MHISCVLCCVVAGHPHRLLPVVGGQAVVQKLQASLAEKEAEVKKAGNNAARAAAALDQVCRVSSVMPRCIPGSLRFWPEILTCRLCLCCLLCPSQHVRRVAKATTLPADRNLMCVFLLL